MKSIAFLFSLCLAVAASAHDVCQTQYTLMHYFQSRCVDVAVAAAVNGTPVTLHSVMVAKDLSAKDTQDTVVFIPGGPGSSSEPLQVALQKRELINGFMGSLKVNAVLFDPRGTGMSKLPTPTTQWTGADISMKLAVEDLKAVIQVHSPSKPVYLFAHSAGGHVALALAAKYPELVKGLLLVSISTSPRQMAILNEAFLAAPFPLWKDLKEIAPVLKSVEAQYLRAEDVTQQQLKARLLKINPVANFRVLTPLILRQQLVLKVSQDPTGQTAVAFIQQVDAQITRLEKENGNLVPEVLRSKKLTVSDLTPEWVGAREMIQRLLMGGEGVLPSELAAATVYDGITFGDFWGAYSLPEGAVPEEPPLPNITAKVIWLSGMDDVIVPTFMVERFAGQLPHSKFLKVPGADHGFFQAKPMLVYNAMEELLKNP